MCVRVTTVILDNGSLSDEQLETPADNMCEYCTDDLIACNFSSVWKTFRLVLIIHANLNSITITICCFSPSITWLISLSSFL